MKLLVKFGKTIVFLLVLFILYQLTIYLKLFSFTHFIRNETVKCKQNQIEYQGALTLIFKQAHPPIKAEKQTHCLSSINFQSFERQKEKIHIVSPVKHSKNYLSLRQTIVNKSRKLVFSSRTYTWNGKFKATHNKYLT